MEMDYVIAHVLNAFAKNAFVLHISKVFFRKESRYKK